MKTATKGNPFNPETQPTQFERWENIAAAIQTGKSNEEIQAEFKVGPKSLTEMRVALTLAQPRRANTEGTPGEGGQSEPPPGTGTGNTPAAE